MPEGDTVYKLAQVLRQGLVGPRLRRLQTRGGLSPFASVPQVVEVMTRGKHCLLGLNNQYWLRIHLGMHGTWHRYPSPWKARGEVHLMLENNSETFVCLRPKEVEIIQSRDLERHPALASLGPDLLAEEIDWAQILDRARAHSAPDRPLGELLLDQRIAAGLGNVYKNELCFLGPLDEDEPWRPGSGTSPYSPWTICSPSELIGLFQRGRMLLQANLGGWPRTTTWDARRVGPPGRQPRCWVYARQGLPCLRCQQPLRGDHQGLQARATCWCTVCQPLGSRNQTTKF